MRRSPAALLAPPALMLAGALPGIAAVPTATIKSASLVGMGAAADVTFAVTCDTGETALMSLDVRQGNKKTGNIANGNGSRSITCTGTPQTEVTRVHTFQFAYAKGEALANTALTDGDGETLITNTTVRIKK